MKKLLVFGDVHLSSMDSWHYEAGEHFIQWFKEKDFGNKEDLEVMFSGDIAEKDTNPGNVIEQMDRLFDLAAEKFSKVYICMGNHDLKLYYKTEQHSLKFLGNKPNTEVIEKECVINTPNGFKVLMLPYKRFDKQLIGDYYNNQLPKEMYDDTYDVLVGHWNIKEETGLAWMRTGVDISKFHAKMYAIGHIHNRVRDEYIGSVFPNTSNEMDTKPRGYKVLDENRNETFETMPSFLEYVTLKYGDKVPERKPNCAYSYVISECDSIEQAAEKYPEIKVRSIERKQSAVTGSIQLNKNNSNLNVLSSDPAAAFDEMIRENQMQLSRKTYNLIKTMLKEKTEH